MEEEEEEEEDEEEEEEDEEEEMRQADGCRWSNRTELAVFNVAGP